MCLFAVSRIMKLELCFMTDARTQMLTFSLFLSHTHTQSQQGVLCLRCFFKFWLLFLCLTHIFLILMADFQKNRKIFLNFCVVVSWGISNSFWLVTTESDWEVGDGSGLSFSYGHSQSLSVVKIIRWE